MSVRAKFRVYGVTQRETGENAQFDVELVAVSSGSEENKQFWKWTPTGNIKLTTINAEAAKQLEPGKEFYVDFTPAEAKEG